MQQIAILEREGAPLRFHLEGNYNANDIGDAVESLIALLDKRFAPFDPDEPDFRSVRDGRPGDPDDAEPDTDLEIGAYVEWHTKPANLRRNGQAELTVGQEDDEAYGDEQDGNFAEDEECASHPSHGSGPGCLVSDPDSAVDDSGCDPDDGI